MIKYDYDQKPLEIGDWVQIVTLKDELGGAGFHGVLAHVYQIGNITSATTRPFYHATEQTKFSGVCLPATCLKRVTGPFVQIPTTETNVIHFVVNKDIYREDIAVPGSIPPIIPKGTKVWQSIRSSTEKFDEILSQYFQKYIHPFNNHWSANIPGSYFDLDETVDQPLRRVLTSKEDSLAPLPVGTKVKIVKATHGWGALKEGDIGVIESVVNPNLYTVSSGTTKNWSGRRICFEVYKEPVNEKSTHQFKIGDQVLVTRHFHNSTGSSCFDKELCCVKGIADRITKPYEVYTVNGNRYVGLFDSAELTLFTDVVKSVNEFATTTSSRSVVMNLSTNTDYPMTPKESTLVLKKLNQKRKLDTSVTNTKISLPKLK